MSKDLVFSFGIGAAVDGSFGSSIGTAKKQISTLGGAMRDLESRRVNLDQFRSLKFGIRDTEKQLTTARQEVSRLAAEMRRTENPSASLRRSFEQAKLNAQGLTAKLSSQQTELHTLRGTMATAGQATSNFKQQQVQLGAAIEKTTRLQQKMKDISEQQSAIKSRRADLRGQMMDTAGMGLAIYAPMKAAISFEKKMAAIGRAVNFDGDEEFKKMGKAIIDLTMPGKGGIPMAASGIADIVSEAARAGIAKKDLLGFAESAAKMGVVFGMESEEIGQFVAKVHTGMELSKDQIVSLGDAISYVSNKMNANALDMSEIVTQTGSMAHVAGLSSEQLVSLGAAFLSSGVSSEGAVSAIGKLLTILERGSEAAAEAKDSFSKLGFDVSDLQDRMQVDPTGTILDVFKAIKEIDPAEQSSMISSIFGLRGGKAQMPLLANLGNLEKAFNLTAQKTNYAGDVQQKYEKRVRKITYTLQALGNVVQNVGINFGSLLLPGISAVLRVVVPLIGGVASLAEKFPLLTTVIGGLAVSLVALKIATLAGAYAWTFLSGGALAAQTAFILTGVAITGNTALLEGNSAAVTVLKIRTIALAVAQKAFAIGSAIMNGALQAVAIGFRILTVAIATNPIGAIITAIAIGGLLIYKYWEPIKAFFSNFSLFDSGAKMIGTLVDGILSVTFAPYTAMKAVLGQVRKLLPFSDAKEGPLSQLTLSGQSIMNTLGSGIRTAAPGLQETMSDALPQAAGLPGAGGRSGGGGGNSIQITISPKIILAPGMNGEQVRSAVDSSMQISESRLRAAMERIFANDRRLSFA